MSKINDLIAKCCPNGVEYRELGDVAEVYTGEQFNKRDMEEVGAYPVINGGISPSGYSDKYNEIENTITVSQGGASAGYVNFIKVKFWLGAHCYAIKLKSDILDNKFVFYCIKQQENKLMQSQEGAGIPSLNRKKLNSILIPVPPLEVQQEVVKILDAFTSLEAELEAELEARKKQYEYYRGGLLSFARSPEILEREQSWRALGEIADVKTGSKPGEIVNVMTDYEYINAGTSNSGFVYAANCAGDTVTTPSRGQGGIGFVGYQKNPFWLGPLCYRTNSITQDVINKYLYYYILQNSNLILQMKKEGGVPAINNSDLIKMPIYVPSLSEQKRIVAILDKFDALVNDISIGLPAEIEARRKQYEYYREKLLTFPKVGCDA